MSGKKHPLLIVVLILVIVALLLGATAVIIIRMSGLSPNLAFTEKIGVVPIDGTILDSQKITSQLIKFRKNKDIKAIILRINSPGGAIGPTQEIYREVQRSLQSKKVIASMGGVAASGGYYIAAAADKIVANPGTITGSIGVVIEFILLEDLFNKIGINLEVLKSGEFKDIGSPHRKLTDRDRELIDDLIADLQGQFVRAVSNGRDLPVEKVLEIADGRIFSGAKAKELGLVDILGDFQDAVENAKNMAGISGEVTLVYPQKSRLDLWSRIFEAAIGSAIKSLQDMKIQAGYQWKGLMPNRVIESR